MAVELFGDWDRMDEILSAPRFRRKLRKHMRKANRRIGLALQRRVRTSIRSGDYAANSPMTVAMKGSSKPLVDNGDLFRAVTYQVDPDGFGLMVGVKRMGTTAGGDTFSIAAALHEGYTIDLRQRPDIRKAVFAKLRKKGRNKKWRPGPGVASPIWVVPGRPFIMQPVQEAWDEGLVLQHWRAAFILALHDVG